MQHHKQTKRGILAGTGQWLLFDPIFKRWKDDSASSILWLHGIPGSGKSKLVYVFYMMSLMIRVLRLLAQW